MLGGWLAGVCRSGKPLGIACLSGGGAMGCEWLVGELGCEWLGGEAVGVRNPSARMVGMVGCFVVKVGWMIETSFM